MSKICLLEGCGKALPRINEKYCSNKCFFASKKGVIPYKKHGMKSHRLYHTWNGIMQRCYNPKSTGFKYYGGRDITVEDRWHDVRNFIKDMNGSYKKCLTLDRINNDGNYCKENCRWATRKEQSRNQRNNVKYMGEMATDASIRLGGHKSFVARRINLGWSEKKAFTIPKIRTGRPVIVKKRNS